MRKGMRFGFTAAEKAEVWDRWRRGESLHEIGRAFGKLSSSVYCQLAHTGGIRPRPRRRSRLALSLSEREEILPRDRGRAVVAFDRRVSGAFTLDGEPGEPAQWGL